ncbi:MAG: hypothetical protein SCARUB_00078 [Candidatus Scalindua rubra]|uniref:Transcriptional regulator n=1 Tax=Candidatus Scalindua rubra TaxID=1872076 RepID=A0A1E3XGS0_9BACT|nr:MAG: hypothetical protein SCARUB_00078 [Candidatus Scalindua rubra]
MGSPIEVNSEYEITLEIETGIVTGKFPRRALTAVLEWYSLHKGELMENWKLVEKREPLKKIKPLE